MSSSFMLLRLQYVKGSARTCGKYHLLTKNRESDQQKLTHYRSFTHSIIKTTTEIAWTSVLFATTIKTPSKCRNRRMKYMVSHSCGMNINTRSSQYHEHNTNARDTVKITFWRLLNILLCMPVHTRPEDRTTRSK